MKYEFRKYLAFVLVILFATACLGGCAVAAAPGDPTVPSNPSAVTDPTQPGTGIKPQGPSVDLPTVPQVLGSAELKQIRLGGYEEGWVTQFRDALGHCVTVSDYEALVKAFDAVKNMGRTVNIPAGYDAEFFAENRLVLIPATSASGSVRYVADAFLDEGKICIQLQGKLAGDVGTADMADWLVLVVLPRNQFPEEMSVVIQVAQQNGPGVGVKDGLDVSDR